MSIGNLGIMNNQITALPETIIPTMEWRLNGFNHQVRARNMDNASAEIWLNNNTPPTVSRGTIAPGEYTAWVRGNKYELWYATAQATGKAMSTVASITIV